MSAGRSVRRVVTRGLAVALTGALVAALAACSPTDAPSDGFTTRAEPAALGAAGLLPKASTQPAPAHLASGLLPPTNRWFSGLAIPKRPQPVFATPLSVTPSLHGFAIGLPTVTATKDTIFGSAVAALGLDLGTSAMQVVRYDTLSVTARWGDAADVTMAEGWPYVAVRARKELTATFSTPLAAGTDAGVWTATIGGTRYAVRAPEGAVDGRMLHLAAGGTAVLFALPDGVPEATMLAGSTSVVTGGTATAKVGATKTSTTLRYTTTAGATVLAALPYQQSGGAGCATGTIPNIAGALHVCTGTSLTYAVPTRTASAILPVSALSASAKARISKALAADVKATPAEPADTYGGGKWLYRLANLLQLAKQVGDDASARTVRATLDASLTRWTQVKGCDARATHCFVYDPRLKGVVGHQASYGSDAFNDHHFHYGYFLYAASVAVTDRPALRARFAPVVNLLAADIASPTATASFPQYRVFDAYAGHSWASGNGAFADGNDEESSSEAVNAWNGLTLWAKATGDRSLQRTGTWLLSTEIATARAEWLYPDLSEFPAYQHTLVALNWGGKRDSATWFSADPAAKLGIQLIPMSPVSTYTKASRARVTAMLREARAQHTGLFADYLLLYARLGGLPRSTALRQLARIPTGSLDSAMSRSYATAFLLTE